MPQVHILYSGTVQGVGFRFTVQRRALRLGLTGWVRNLPDGRVETLVEGQEHSLQEFIHQVDEHFEGYIRDKKVIHLQKEEALEDFRIVF